MTNDEETKVIALHPRHTLAQTWSKLAETFIKTGAHADQVATMKMVFYLGAAQTYARIDGGTDGYDSFCGIMEDIHREVDDVMRTGGFPTQGNA
jgi:hypothetical protein